MDPETDINVNASTSQSRDDKNAEPPVEEEGETRVITLDTIIRKGLIEQMPMTAKDINSIVSKSLQKERDRQAADKLRLAALKAKQVDSEDDTESSDYDSTNEQDIAEDSEKSKTPVPGKQQDNIHAHDQPGPSNSTRKDFESVPKITANDTQMLVSDNLTNIPDEPEDFELRSGDLHYSESNPSDYSESELKLSNSQPSKKRETLIKKRELSTIIEKRPMLDQDSSVVTTKKQRLDESASCTDSKRNAILLQCSTELGASSNRLYSTKKDGATTIKSKSSISQNETQNDRPVDHNIAIGSIFQEQQGQKSRDEDASNISKIEEPLVIIKEERESPIEDMLEIHHIEDFDPSLPTLGRGSKNSKSKASFTRSTYSEKKISPKPIKRTKKYSIDSEALDTSLVQLQPDMPRIHSVISTSSQPSKLIASTKPVQKRDKRLSVRSNPVYAELSDSSNDNIDAKLPKQVVDTGPSTSSKLISVAANKAPNPDMKASGNNSTNVNPITPKMHWKTQLKLKRQQTESGLKPNTSRKPPAGTSTVSEKESSKEVKDKSIESERTIDDEDTLEDDTVVNRIIEPPHHQKRIPKLKYGSFNFTERRGTLAKGPKMVLKYKKKYKKKSKQLIPAVGSGVQLEDSNPTEVAAYEARPTKKIVTAVRKTSKLHSEPLETESVINPTIKLPKSDKSVATSRSLKEQNRVLLDILDQRSSEIRNLKIRLSNAMRSNLFPNANEHVEHVKPTSKMLTQVNLKMEPNEDPRTPEWSADELIQSFSLQKLNRNLYAHIQQKYSLPLALSTDIDEFIGKLRLESGHLLTNILKLLHYDGEHMSELERVTVLQISQIPLKASYSYVEKTDSIHHSTSDRLFIILARGLVGNWQQPIYLNSTADNLTNVMKLAIAKLNDIKFNVIACCSRFEEDDPNTIWTDLGACRGYSYFSHPITNDPIYTFYYVDDILRAVYKLLMKENGFETDMGAKINREPIDVLMQKSSGINTLVQDINEPNSFFTSRTSDLLRILRPENYNACADFVDVFAAYQKMLRSEDYGGENLERQIQILSHVQLQLYKLKCKSTIIPDFKQTITHSIESLKLLQHSMRQKYNVDSFPARSVSEDFIRPIVKEPIYWESALTTLRNISFPQRIASAMSTTDTFSLATPEKNYVQQIVDDIAEQYVAADKDKFVNDLWRIEEKFNVLWTPLFSGNAHVLRDTLGKVKPSTSLEGSVVFVRKRIELRLNVINALGGVAGWTKYQGN